MKTKPSKTHTFCLFTTPDPKIMNGPFYLDDTEEATHQIVCTLGKPGEAHQTEIYRRGKDGKPVGKPLAYGELRRQIRKNPDAPQLLHMVTIGKKFIRQVGWTQEHETAGQYFWFKPDTIGARNVSLDSI